MCALRIHMSSMSVTGHTMAKSCIVPFTLRLYLMPIHGFLVDPASNFRADEPVRSVI
eukprot:COSAG02_NODE_664_length_18739_cov_11.071567_23_plen_57_part_00